MKWWIEEEAHSPASRPCLVESEAGAVILSGS